MVRIKRTPIRKIRRRRLKSRFEESRKQIKSAILSEKPKDADIVDIQEHYQRSTITLGEYVTLDWDHRKDINDLINKISSYLEDPTRNRPLNVVMLAEPGSGKSHFIKCLAQSLSSIDVSAVSFNMATLQDIDDLIQPLEAVRNLKVVDRLPMLFLDEFDIGPAGYSLLLPLLWDGELHVGNRDVKLGKLVIVMAGSDPKVRKVMKSARSMQKEFSNTQPNGVQSDKKLVDLLSRINGGVIEIPDLDSVKKDRDRRVDKVCITISLLQQRFGENLQLIPWSLLHFIASGRFRYGVRSIAHLIDLIPWDSDIKDKLTVNDLDLPFNSEEELKKSSLAYHLIADEEPKEIIHMWESIEDCNCLVRFRPEPEDEYL
jgi:hypothetical protein